MRLSAVWVAGVFIFTSIFSWLVSSLFRNQSPSRLTIAEQVFCFSFIFVYVYVFVFFFVFVLVFVFFCFLYLYFFFVF